MDLAGHFAIHIVSTTYDDLDDRTRTVTKQFILDTFATLLGGILWAAVYQRSPNLYALALSHSIMTTVLSSTIYSAVLHGMRVGYNYF